jgi:hypothetical protein
MKIFTAKKKTTKILYSDVEPGMMISTPAGPALVLDVIHDGHFVIIQTNVCKTFSTSSSKVPIYY